MGGTHKNRVESFVCSIPHSECVLLGSAYKNECLNGQSPVSSQNYISSRGKWTTRVTVTLLGHKD